METGKVYHGSTTVRKFVTDKKVGTLKWQLSEDDKYNVNIVCNAIGAALNRVSRENPNYALNNIEVNREDLSNSIFSACLNFRDLSKSDTNAKD